MRERTIERMNETHKYLLRLEIESMNETSNSHPSKL